MEYQHRALVAGRWFTYTFDEQMGNIGSETSRMLKAGDDRQRFEAAKRRGLELLDLTISDPRWQDRLGELAEVQRKFIRVEQSSEAYHDMLKELDWHFLQFAYAARAGR